MASNKAQKNVFKDKDIVWVKFARTWWPAEVCAESRVPDDLRKYVKGSPFAYVHFFEEDK